MKDNTCFPTNKVKIKCKEKGKRSKLCLTFINQLIEPDHLKVAQHQIKYM